MNPTTQQQIADRAAAMERVRDAVASFCALILTSPIDHISEEPMARMVSEVLPFIAALEAQTNLQIGTIDGGHNDPMSAFMFVAQNMEGVAQQAVDGMIADVVSRAGAEDTSKSPLASAFRLA